MNREDLAEIIVEHVNNLEDSITVLKKEIEFVEDVIKVKEKHNRNLFDENKKLDKLKTQLETTENVKDSLEDVFTNHDIEFEEIEKI